MFSGIVRGMARVGGVERRGAGVRLAVEGGRALRGVRPGESVAVSGICLTAVGAGRGSGRVVFDVVAETLGRTTLGAWRPGRRVNVERALRWGDRLGGHVVTGHVDGACSVRVVRDVAPAPAARGGSRALARDRSGAAPRRGSGPAGGREVVIAVEPALARALADRGSVAVDGVSLTVAGRGRDAFRVCLIPETLRRTTLGRLAPGDRVNVERDHGSEAAGREIERAGVTWALLKRCGFR